MYMYIVPNFKVWIYKHMYSLFISKEARIFVSKDKTGAVSIIRIDTHFLKHDDDLQRLTKSSASPIHSLPLIFDKSA